jgi:hypothetical protein
VPSLSMSVIPANPNASLVAAFGLRVFGFF